MLNFNISIEQIETIQFFFQVLSSVFNIWLFRVLDAFDHFPHNLKWFYHFSSFFSSSSSEKQKESTQSMHNAHACGREQSGKIIYVFLKFFFMDVSQ